VSLSACHNSLMNTFTLCGGTLVRRGSEEIAWFPFRGEVRMLCVIQLPPSMETGTILLRVPRAHRVYRAHGAPVPTDHDPRAHGVIWFCLFFWYSPLCILLVMKIVVLMLVSMSQSFYIFIMGLSQVLNVL